MRNSVVLPAPFGPTSPTFSPFWMPIEASMNRIWWPFCLEMLSRRIMGGLLARGRAERQPQTPRLAPGDLDHSTGPTLPADLEAGRGGRASAGAGAARAAGADGVGDHEFDPQLVAVLVVGGVGGGAQGGQAGLRLARGALGEPGELEDDRGALVHFPQGKGQGLASRLHPDLGAAADRGLAGIFKSPAAPGQDDRLGDGFAAEAEIGAYGEAAEVAAAHGGVPVRL